MPARATNAAIGATPRSTKRIEDLLAQADLGIEARVPHPLTGLPEPIRIDRRVLSSLLRVPLYSPQLSAVLPYALAQATDGDFTPLVALSAAVAGGINENFAAGMHFAVVCAEDMPRVDAGQRAKIAATRFGNAFLDVYERACKGVPSRPVPPGFYEIPASRTPVLVLSGGLDPATPPRHGARVAEQLGNARHIVAPYLGHIVSTSGCAPTQMARFIRDAALRQGRRRLPDPPAGSDVLRADRPGARGGIGDDEGTGAMIEVEHLAKQFDARVEGRRARVVAVEDIGFTALDGRITALLGPNGAGKTTTMRVVAGLVRADRGHARVGGVDVAADPHAVRAQLGMLSDARGLYARLTARENVHYYADLRRVPRADGDSAAGDDRRPAGHGRAARSPHRRLLDRRADEGRARPRADPRSAAPDPRRADQRTRRRVDARAAPAAAAPARGGQVHRHLDPHHAGGRAARRRDRDRGARTHRGARHRRR